MNRTTFRYCLMLLVVSAVALAAMPAHAATLAYDGFDYTVGLNAWDGAGGTETGFSGNWATDDDWATAGVQTGNGYNNVVAGLTFGTYAVSGNAVQLIADRVADPRGLPVGGRAASFNSGNNYYTSHLFNLTSTTSEPSSNSEMNISPTQLTGGAATDVRQVAGQGKFGTTLAAATGFLVEGIEVVGTTYMYVSGFA